MVDIFLQALGVLIAAAGGAVGLWIKTAPERKRAEAELAKAQAEAVRAQLQLTEAQAVTQSTERASSPDEGSRKTAWASFPAHAGPWQAPIKTLTDKYEALDRRVDDEVRRLDDKIHDAREMFRELKGRVNGRSRTTSKG
jgi:hypothetical protein